MKRFFTVLLLDFSMQFRYGIYWAVLVVAGMWMGILSWLPDSTLPYAFPAILFSDLTVIGFYFVAGLILLEKGEGILKALQTTPLRTGEFLASRFSSMVLLSLVVTLIIVVPIASIRGVFWSPVALIPAVLLSSSFFTIVGFLYVAPFERITNFLMSSVPGLFVLSLPLLDLFGLLEGSQVRFLFFVIPSHAALILIKGSFFPVSIIETLYGYTYLIFWIGLLLRFSLTVFRRAYLGDRGAKK